MTRGFPLTDFVVCGAAPDTGNLGVSALCYSVLDGVGSRAGTRVATVFDHGRGSRSVCHVTASGSVKIILCGASHTRRLHRSESLQRNYMASRLRLGWCGGPPLSAIQHVSAVLDVSGGDSFSDIYGMRRFWSMVYPKLISLDCKTPLILLPQTYGPFTSSKARRMAERIVRGATQCWARDAHSFEILKALLDDRFDPCRHHCGVDMAFTLEVIKPDNLPNVITTWFDVADHGGSSVVGLNISGLIYNQPSVASEQYGLGLNYTEVVCSLVTKLLVESDAKVLLVPHVAPTRDDSPEDDAHACRSVLESVPANLRDRIAVAPVFDDPRHVKWLISRCSWFCGTRMHSTIASLSTGVPTATLAYSGKAQGVFEMCGQGKHVADMRHLATEDAIERVWKSWTTRVEAKASLAARMPNVIERAEAQMDEIVAACSGNHAGDGNSSR